MEGTNYKIEYEVVERTPGWDSEDLEMQIWS